MDKDIVENALKHAQLWALMGNGRYWRLRRNGQTQTWKTRPSDYRIPVKAGMKAYGQVTHNDKIGDSFDTRADFVISTTEYK